MKTTKINLLIILLFTAFAVKAQPEGVSIKKNSSPPDPSAMLEIYADDKGLLIPRVAITASNTAGPITGTPMPANSLLVYNTNAAYAGSVNGGSGTGFYYWRSINSTTGYWIKLFDGGMSAGGMGSFIPKVTFAQMQAMTTNMGEPDLGAMVFVITDVPQLIYNGGAVGTTIFYPSLTGGVKQNFTVFGLWYFSRVPVCGGYAVGYGYAWKYFSYTSLGVPGSIPNINDTHGGVNCN